MIKPRVFIGSARESLDVAKVVKELLSKDFDVFIWTDEIFKENESPLQTLLTEAGLFDFGIMILSKDDHTTSREEGFETPRDNTLFEFGIFLGRIGDGRAFGLAEEGVKLPSDLYGVTIEHYSKRPDAENHLLLKECMRKIAKQMLETSRLGYLRMLPSTALALGYYNNFVKDVVEGIANGLSVTVGKRSITLQKLIIVMPGDLDADMKRRATLYYRLRGLKEAQTHSLHRTRPLFVMLEDKANSCCAFDLPTTLDGIDKAIDMYLRKGFVGKSDRQKLLEEQELRNFRCVLELLINEDAYARKYVSIIDEDIR